MFFWQAELLYPQKRQRRKKIDIEQNNSGTNTKAN
jgi:hypothetical protein